MIAVVDYGMGNLRSIAKALEHVGAAVAVTSDEGDLRAAERIILPGVGAFGEAASNLRETGLVAVLEEQVLNGPKPFLGVCLGMQLLARESFEHGRHSGLGWVAGEVVPLERTDPMQPIPHTGWNEVDVTGGEGSPLAKLRSGEAFYFNHSYHFVPDSDTVVAARCDHGQRFVAAIAHENIVATQFHPEKSQRAGLELLADFAVWEPDRLGQAIRTSTP
jgi:glutamine amidotransferase